MERMATNEQAGLFPEQEKIKKLEEKIKSNHWKVKDLCKDISGYGKFFKLFSDYTTALEGAQTDDADDLLLENIGFAQKESEKLAKSLKRAEKLLKEARVAAVEIEVIQERHGIAPSKTNDEPFESDEENI